MATIRFKDAVKFDENLPWQNEAWDFLQNAVHKEILDEFERLYRNQPKINYLVDIPKPGFDLIKKFEGCHLNAYYDPLTRGLPITIGWGSTKKLDGSPFFIGDKITQQEADELFAKTLKKEYLPSLTKIPYWNEMNNNQKGALLCFAYNLGPNFYGHSDFKSITNVLRKKEWEKVPDTLFKYRNPGSSVEAGLMRRRMEEGKLWNTPPNN